jgi:predicted ATPase/class 3 adenylate cyclase
MPAERSLPTGTLTFVFTDIEDSTKHVQHFGTAAWGEVLGDHGRIIRTAFDAHGGTGIRTEGDAFFYVFVHATEALAAVVEAQRHLAFHTFPHGAAVRVRIGLHTGEASVGTSESGIDYVGYDVHRAARIAAAGHGGQVLLSETTQALIRDALPTGVSLTNLGAHRFKDLSRAEIVWQLVVPGLPEKFPRLRALEAVPHNLPVQLTSFVGREDAIADGLRLLESSRLLTLTGPGGTGKTRLSLQIAAQIANQFSGGVTFVPLATITDPDHVGPAIVQALGLDDGVPIPAQDRLTSYLESRDTLLVLDNFEQVLDAASLVADLLRGCPRLKVLTSSRAPLRITGEQELPVAPLALPDPRAALTPETVTQFEAVRLFIERAVAVRPGFQVTNDNAPAVAEICARLDGLPLAIELAAARVRLLPPAAILARLEHRLGLLQSGARDLPARQQTLRGAIDWSYDLLDPPSRRLFARLAVFAGGCTLDDAEAVCAEGLGADFFEVVSGLCDHSLVRRDEAEHVPRLFMLETIREYASERLAAEPDAGDVRRRHVTRYLELTKTAEPHFLGTDRKQWLTRLEREHDNLRAALDHALSIAEASRAMELCGMLWRFWQMRGHLAEGRRYTDAALALPDASAHAGERERALEGAGGIAYWQGDLEATRSYYGEAVDLARASGDKKRLANALYNYSFTGWMAASKTDDLAHVLENEAFKARRGILEEALSIARETGDSQTIARVLWGLAMVHHENGDTPGAIPILDECAQRFRDVGDLFGLAWALHTQGNVHVRLGHYDVARRAYQEQLEILAEASDAPGATVALADYAELLLEEGNRAGAFRLYAASAAMRKAFGAHLATIADTMQGRSIQPRPGDEDAWNAGLHMSLEEAIRFALADGTER